MLRANVVLEGVVTSWTEAAARLHKIFMLAARQTETAAALHTGTAAKAWRKDTEASESALRALVPKAGSGALAQGYVAAALVIAPLFSDKFVNTESGQTVGDTALAEETARLVHNTEMVNGVPIGYAAHALIFSNGSAVGALPAKGR